ncbi:MAG: hypothetical protein ACHQYP_09505 [Nitrospiria bacterium]
MGSGDRHADAIGFITPRQIKSIKKLASRIGWNEDTLLEKIEAHSGKLSIHSLSRQEAKNLMEELFLKISGPVIQYDFVHQKDISRGLATPAQLALIREMGERIEWNEWRILRLAYRMYHVSQLVELEVKQASGLIEALTETIVNLGLKGL